VPGLPTKQATQAVTRAVQHMLGKPVASVAFSATPLHGGTVADVQLISGSARTASGTRQDFRLVWKTQRRWERPGDPDSWRREYDLYHSDFASFFSGDFRWPHCHLAELAGDETTVALEYISGPSGVSLSGDMLAQAARELGRFQGRMAARTDWRSRLGGLSDIDFMAREHSQWHSSPWTWAFLSSEQCRAPEPVKQWIRDHPWQDGKSVEYHFLRSAEFAVPRSLQKMLIDIDDQRELIFSRIRRLPVTLCHRDFWIENIFYVNGGIVLIDWDCAGPGYLGEDIASLVIDETATNDLEDYFRRLIPAYWAGLATYIDGMPVDANMIWQMMLVKFGYRMVQEYLFAVNDTARAACVERLAVLAELGHLPD
jgi:hypothetical protein